MNVISIQSQVAFGHVGNSAAVFPMQMHGIDVVAVPTTLLSNRPGYPTIRGRVLDAQLLADLLRGIDCAAFLDPEQEIGNELRIEHPAADGRVAGPVAQQRGRHRHHVDPVHLHRKYGGTVADMAESDLRLN